MTDADAALLSLGHQLTADVVACSIMLAQVHGYERREHGRLVEVRPYLTGRAVHEHLGLPEGLEDSERAALHDLRHNMFERLDPYLRAGSLELYPPWDPRSGSPPAPSDPREMERYKDAIDSAFDKARPTTEPLEVYRGLGHHLIGVKPGQVLEDLTYQSTTTRRDMAKSYGSGEYPHRTYLRLHIPPGSRVISQANMGIHEYYAKTGDHWDSDTGAGYDPSGEEEVLLPRGSRYKITAVHPDGRVDADLLPPDNQLRLAQEHVKGYERVVHGKTEFVHPYDRLGRRRVWVSSDGQWLLRLGHNGMLQVRKSYPGMFHPWREVDPKSVGVDDYFKMRPWADILKEGAVEVTTPPHLPAPKGPVADPHVISDPGMPDPKVVQDYLKAHLTPAELDVLNKAHVTWHLLPQATFNKLYPHTGTVGMYIGTDRLVRISGDAIRSMDREAVLKQLDLKAEAPHGVKIGPPYGDDWQHVILHETGHALDHALGFPSNRDKAFHDYAAAAFPHGTHAAENPGEAFAELFGAMRRGEWSDPAAGYPAPVPEDIQRAEEEYVERAEREGIPLTAELEPQPLCVARYLPDGSLTFGPIKGE